MVSQSCKDGDVDRVMSLVDGIYAEQLQRSQLMSAFLMQDVDSAKNRILQRKHRERAIRAGEDKRLPHTAGSKLVFRLLVSHPGRFSRHRPRHRARRARIALVPMVGVRSVAICVLDQMLCDCDGSLTKCVFFHHQQRRRRTAHCSGARRPACCEESIQCTWTSK